MIFSVRVLQICNRNPGRTAGRLLSLLLTAVIAASGCSGVTNSLSDSQRTIVERARAHAATQLTASAIADGGLILGGELAGHQFALVVPQDWNHQALLFAHGYSTPGSAVSVAENPLEADPSGGLLPLAYSQGFAVGHSAYAKAGMGVQSGAENTLRLKQLVDRLGADKVYIAGGSMGGNIVMALIERHPATFAGALAACGVVDSWSAEIGALIDMRAAYNYFTAGTEYALPGRSSIAVSALSPEPPDLLGFMATPYRYLQIKRIADPILALFEAAREDPDGPQMRMIRRIASVTVFEPELASFLAPLITVSLGMDDFNRTFGGLIYDSSARDYRSALLTDAENAALNQAIERMKADPLAMARADEWHRSTGRFDTKLMTIHNSIDSLVPYAQHTALGARVAQAGNSARLVQVTVPPVSVPIAGTGLKGLAHCGFTPAQTAESWNSLTRWVESGERPAETSAPGS